MVTTEAPGNDQQLGRAALAYATRGASVHACHWPTPVEFPPTPRSRPCPLEPWCCHPAALMGRNRLGWMRRLDHVTHLPAATPLLAQLTDFVATGALYDPHPLVAS